MKINNDLPFVPCSLKLACLVFSLLTLAVDGDFYAKIVFKMEKKKVFCSFLDQVALNIHPIPPANKSSAAQGHLQLSINSTLHNESEYGGRGVHGLFSEIKICSQHFVRLVRIRLYTILFAFSSLLFTLPTIRIS
jgi:hypothetical protein